MELTSFPENSALVLRSVRRASVIDSRCKWEMQTDTEHGAEPPDTRPSQTMLAGSRMHLELRMKLLDI